MPIHRTPSIEAAVSTGFPVLGISMFASKRGVGNGKVAQAESDQGKIQLFRPSITNLTPRASPVSRSHFFESSLAAT
jgi:hypothetical protein